MALKLMGKKRGMSQLFDKKGNAVVCTVIEVEPNVITQIKTKAIDGYEAVQLGFDTVVTKDPRTVVTRVKKPLVGHYKKASVAPRRHLAESRLDKGEEYSLGQEIGVDYFSEVTFIDVCGRSKGKGYQGVIKLHGFAGGPAAHGSSFHRHAGSTGMRSTPGRCLPGGKRASHMGDDRKTVQSLEIFEIIPEKNLIIVRGSVPGAINGLVYISTAIKKAAPKKA
ncbi:MAG: 50S ribosomal protein L3 [Parachlamydiaceae bacterium]|nr:50S ribosomal protein L3 [Parachlamydiaceae bacterium]